MSNGKLVILFGSPGSGKGTQALLLADKKKMTHLEASKILEKKFIKAKSEDVVKLDGTEYSLKEQERRWREGLLVEDGFVAHVMKESVEAAREDGLSVLVDGYPRTVGQVELALPFILSLYKVSDILVIYLEVGEEESFKRNSNRRVCSLMRHSIINLPETKDLTICPVDGSSLEKRTLDKPETIKVRLKNFRKKTLPVIDYLESQKIQVSRIDGVGSISDVFFRILKEAEKFGI